ncbi:transposase family protein [Paenibacillus thiaminolyticus]
MRWSSAWKPSNWTYTSSCESGRFPCAKCGEPNQPVRDIANHDRTWRHLNFFEYPCYIHAELPRTNCGRCNSITRVNVPWGTG